MIAAPIVNDEIIIRQVLMLIERLFGTACVMYSKRNDRTAYLMWLNNVY